MLKRFVQIFGGDPQKRIIEELSAIVDEINALEPAFEGLSDEALLAKTAEFRRRLKDGEDLDDLLPEAFAAVREASKRTIGLRHYDVQLIGGIALHQGKIAEMRTGEGKTLVATLPLYLNALTGRGTHLVTVNDYLARRDARWMAPIYHSLGLQVGVLQMAARTENGKKAFIVDLERESPHEDQDKLRMVARREAYAADITYGTNSEFGFDYLRDNMTMRLTDRVQRGHSYAIIDEVDNVLIDEARTPLIISGPAQDEAEWYVRMAQIVKQLRPEDYEVAERDRTVTLTEIGEAHVEQLLGMALRDPDRPEDVTPEQARMLGYLEQALRAQHLFHRNKDYLVQAGRVVIVDEFTGRLMPGRRWSDGLHQAVEAKEGTRVQAENVTYATITIQNYYRMYDKLSGMTGTAVTEAEEFDKIYKLDVLAIPTNLEYRASRSDADLETVEARDDQGYRFTYYAHRDNPQQDPVFWKRKDYPDVVYRTGEAKLRAITREILQYHVSGRPILVGTTSVELSDRVSSRLRAEPLRRLAQVLLLRSYWFEANNRVEDGRMVEELHLLDEEIDQLDISAMRKLARELSISFNPQDDGNVDRLLHILNLPVADENRQRLVAGLQGGISHQVLNARKHTEESKIIEGAGAYGAVTIATNMAGRGVDIKLGGELPEDVISNVNRVLRRAGFEDPYDMSPDERYQALREIPSADYGIYDSDVQHYFQYMEEMARVRELGGLHVIGSERHEARRIDNQLRGRSARQGDPGSSRFYLSMEDELMRLFGGQQADALMQRMKIDDAMPLEVGLVSRIVEQSQTRVEGANFDVRKHLLEYDDVLNSQRAKVYEQRNRIFTKEDLSEDVVDMLRNEINARVPLALQDEEGPWKLLAWLEQIQPPIQVGNQVFPSYTLKLIADGLSPEALSNRDGALQALVELADQAITTEEQHYLSTVNFLLDQTRERLLMQIDERREISDNFFSELAYADETNLRPPKELVDELGSLLRFPLRLSSEYQRLLRDPQDSQARDQVQAEVEAQLETFLVSQAIRRLLGSIERRLDQSLDVDFTQLASADWDEVSEAVLSAVQDVYAKQRERYLGENGQVTRDLENVLARVEGPIGQQSLYQLLMLLPQGSKAIFDKKTHRRVMQRTTRLTYLFTAAAQLEQREPEEITEQVLAHLEEAQAFMHRAWGVAEWSRVANSSLADLEARAQSGLRTMLGEEQFQALYQQPVGAFPPEAREKTMLELGRQALTEIYRQLLLQVITELWVDYLTQMEALRVSIGLEAYAQRDPLVQYKNRAYELFQTLLDDMRRGVVTRMFTFRPRDMSAVQTTVARQESAAEAIEAEDEGEPVTETVAQEANGDQKPGPAADNKRRKRRRRRR